MMKQKLFREQDLINLGFTFLNEDSEKNTLPTLCLNSDISSIDGNIDVTVNLRFEKDFHCKGFIRAVDVTSSSSLSVDNFISCQNLNIGKDLLVKDSLISKNVTCQNSLIVMNRVDVSTIKAYSITVKENTEALEIRAKKLLLEHYVSARSIIID